MAQPTVTDARTARISLSEKMAKLAAIANNVGTFAVMAEDARSRGDHILAKKHLRKALDYEFEMFAACPVIGELVQAWYPEQEI